MTDHIIRLYEDFPVLLENVYCGIRFGVGWEPLVRRLCTALSTKYQKVRCDQIKEKFGGLRFYVHDSCPEADELIHEAEAESFTICENCGAPGEPRSDRWIRTLCDGCAGRN